MKNSNEQKKREDGENNMERLNMRLLSKQCHQCNNGWLEEPDQNECHDSAKGVMFCNNCSFAYRITKADYAVKQEGANDKIEKVRKGGWIVRIVGEGVSA